MVDRYVLVTYTADEATADEIEDRIADLVHGDDRLDNQSVSCGPMSEGVVLEPEGPG